ncbi:hypothetical protein N9W34_05960 [Rickettsiales bacterium]|nr:hypothetical protein [Rickettsiales bacterium]
MELLQDRVVRDAHAARERQSRPKWRIGGKGNSSSDYEELLKQTLGKFLENKGAVKVDGSLLFEFIPKATSSGARLISNETASFFHSLQEDGASDVGENADISKKLYNKAA